MDVNGRFSLTQTPQALPGNCGGCGKATCPLGFIDTGLQFEYHGALIFCAECVLDMASKFGYVNMETADRLKSRVVALEEENMRQRAALLGVEEAIDGLQTIRDNLNHLSNGKSPTPPVPEVTDIPSQETENVGSAISEASESEITGGDSETNESSSVKEPVGVSSSSGFVDLDEL